MSLKNFICLFFLFGCKPPAEEFIKTDLHQYGLPFAILTPDSVVIERKDYEFISDITLRKMPGYDLQIFESPASTPSASALKSAELAALWEEPFFKEIVYDEPHGFIFKREIDGKEDYDFRFYKVIGDKEYVFQAGVSGTFTEEEITHMYESLK